MGKIHRVKRVTSTKQRILTPPPMSAYDMDSPTSDETFVMAGCSGEAVELPNLQEWEAKSSAVPEICNILASEEMEYTAIVGKKNYKNNNPKKEYGSGITEEEEEGSKDVIKKAVSSKTVSNDVEGSKVNDQEEGSKGVRNQKKTTKSVKKGDGTGSKKEEVDRNVKEKKRVADIVKEGGNDDKEEKIRARTKKPDKNSNITVSQFNMESLRRSPRRHLNLEDTDDDFEVPVPETTVPLAVAGKPGKVGSLREKKKDIMAVSQKQKDTTERDSVKKDKVKVSKNKKEQTSRPKSDTSVAKHDLVLDLILKALEEHHERKGVSVPTIKKYVIEHNGGQRSWSKLMPRVKKALNTALEEGQILRSKGTENENGLRGRFKVNKKFRSTKVAKKVVDSGDEEDESDSTESLQKKTENPTKGDTKPVKPKPLKLQNRQLNRVSLTSKDSANQKKKPTKAKATAQSTGAAKAKATALPTGTAALTKDHGQTKTLNPPRPTKGGRRNSRSGDIVVSSSPESNVVKRSHSADSKNAKNPKARKTNIREF